ncbi:UNVERIFIED_CONTAM: hypothetical protein Slati_0836300 [Sesamum latifolium]|uniref:Uncharacterized protein n=1 Tax=Sesamum latifolium TaxID=2727402 RepID=A0AAW2XMI7_9LAMI
MSECLCRRPLFVQSISSSNLNITHPVPNLITFFPFHQSFYQFCDLLSPTTPFSFSFTLIAPFRPSVKNTAFILCSKHSGHAIIGTPNTVLSSIEFHPQCVTNPPVDLCSALEFEEPMRPPLVLSL